MCERTKLEWDTYLGFLVSHIGYVRFKGVCLSRTFKKSIFLFCFNRWIYYQRILSQNFTVHIGIVLMVEFRAVACAEREEGFFHRLKTLKRVFSKQHFSKLRTRLKENQLSYYYKLFFFYL